MRQFLRTRRGGEMKPAADHRVNDALIRDRLNRTMRRRMSDDLVSLIRRACLIGHAETAKALWLVLADLTAREARQHFPHGRQPDNDVIEQLGLEVAAAVQKASTTQDPMPERLVIT
jgi:hypothetical protein